MPRRPPHPGPQRRAIGVLCFVALACGVARHAEAFFPTNLRTLGGIQGHSHEAITTDALVALDAELFGAAQPTDSMRAAIDAIVEGNVHVDDDQLHSALHFDGENFFAGQGRLLGIKEIVIASIQQNDTQGARNDSTCTPSPDTVSATDSRLAPFATPLATVPFSSTLTVRFTSANSAVPVSRTSPNVRITLWS